MIRRFFSNTNKSFISITDSAWDKIISISKHQGSKGFLFFAESGGCNGFNYKLELINENNYNKILKNNKIKPTILKKNEKQLIIDPLSEMYLIGTTIDYTKEDFHKGIFENKFIFLPNKEKVSSCGCGVSFSIK